MLFRTNSLLAFGATCFALVSAQSSFVNQTTVNGNTYTYQQLAGYGAIASNARDVFGDTIGGIGSAIAIDRKTWFKWGNGSYTGLLWALPGRCWLT